MTVSYVRFAPRRPLTPARPLLAAALHAPSARPDPAWWAAQVRLAEASGLDFVTLECGPADPLLLAARLPAQTERIGLVPVVATTVTEPFHVSTALATIDIVAGGRAGWLATTRPRADADGLVTWAVPADVDGDAAEHVEAVRRLWDSWEDGWELRDAASARFLDRDRVHHVDFTGDHLSVRGPSITPRPPQGSPPVLVRDGVGDGLAGAADAVLTRGAGAGAGSGVPRLLELDADAPDLAARVADATGAGFAGAVLHAGDLAAALALLPPREAAPAGTLRERLGLVPAANRYAA